MLNGKPKDKTATLYYFRIIDLERLLGKERNGRKRAETEAEELKRKLREAEEKIKRLEEENENLKECRKTYTRMLFKGNTKKMSSPRRGQKKGHPGISRRKPGENLIRKETDVTLSVCTECGSVLGGCKRRYERVIEDIVIQPETEVIRYRIHQYECGNCGKSLSARSSGIIGQSPFGRRVFAAVIFYRYRMKTPLKKIAEALREIHGLKISEAGIQNLLYQASVQFGEKYEELRQLITDGNMINADETGWRVNGENWWTWIWSNDKATVYTTERTRGRGIPQKMLKTFKGLLNRDGCDSYNIVNTAQQICWVHLLRKAHEYCARDRVSREMILLKDTLKACYRKMRRWHRGKHTEEERYVFHSRMRQMFISLRKEREWKSGDAAVFIREWLMQHQDRLTTFLKYAYASPHNNAAERDLRPLVVFRKITGGSKSEKGIKATDINMSIIETWTKQKLSVIQQIPVFGLSL
ncbi:IS66 family transposase [Patescibacteria group bacterium]|nr:IS66 family transposase [Patescibacteria group bacterium]